MNINPLMTALGAAVGLPIEQDEYTGGADKFLTFTYEQENDDLFGDDLPEAETAAIQISLYTPRSYDYLEKKDEIKQYLRNHGFYGIKCSSWLEEVILGTQRRRHTVFECQTTKGIGK